MAATRSVDRLNAATAAEWSTARGGAGNPSSSVLTYHPRATPADRARATSIAAYFGVSRSWILATWAWSGTSTPAKSGQSPPGSPSIIATACRTSAAVVVPSSTAFTSSRDRRPRRCTRTNAGRFIRPCGWSGAGLLGAPAKGLPAPVAGSCSITSGSRSSCKYVAELGSTLMRTHGALPSSVRPAPCDRTHRPDDASQTISGAPVTFHAVPRQANDSFQFHAGRRRPPRHAVAPMAVSGSWPATCTSSARRSCSVGYTATSLPSNW